MIWFRFPKEKEWQKRQIIYCIFRTIQLRNLKSLKELKLSSWNCATQINLRKKNSMKTPNGSRESKAFFDANVVEIDKMVREEFSNFDQIWSVKIVTKIFRSKCGKPIKMFHEMLMQMIEPLQ